MSYKTTIGLEVHAELKTVSKMFCGCKNDPHEGEPNAHICPVCLAHPGTLPVPNESAIEKVLIFGQAIGATKATYSEFDRKNYFYPDIPKAYQISQYAFPFLTAGNICGVALTRVHLEEDTARSIHDQGSSSLVDFNRAGVPLMELVTEPVIHDAETAVTFARELQLLLRTLNISDANMERGEMRVEANISVSKTGEVGPDYVEVKNLNSFKAVEGAINYEITRQIALMEAGKPLKKETRGWNEHKLSTFSQRTKETAKDYRYFPDPDLTKMNTALYKGFSESLLAEKIGKLPDEKRGIYSNLGLPSKIIETMLSEKELDAFYLTLIDTELGKNPEAMKLAANYLTSDVVALINNEDKNLTDLGVSEFAELIEMLVAKEINSRVAKNLIVELFDSNKGPREIATDKNLLMISDTSELEGIIDTILEENVVVAEELRAGKDSVLKFLVGQGMKATKGSADPELLADMILRKTSR